MIIAVIAMRMVQMAIDEIVDVITMRYRLMAAAGSVDMTGIVASTCMIRRAHIGILVAHFDHMLDDRTIFADVMKMTIVQIVDVIAVPHTGVLAIGPVLMIVILVNLAHQLAPVSGGMFDRVHDAVRHKTRYVLVS